ncbi:class I SAM-dependent methyltransferase [Sphingomonas sp.]|uniref:class I SAM-dependent DNA methyltransferase n=1 Tax=Sphingomonas sp. TaxID=28214 RepID=UPI001EC17C21|nr:class I SAM-dependent methyltransferase [Sphingomonas sp.]MBX3595511.1 class I SAM-dependent methyltransferase [Sphingomonas sp.]
MPGRIGDLYHRYAPAFDAARRRDFPERAWFDRFMRSIPRGGHLLDLGCGGGEPVARYLIDRGYRLTGVDIAPAMIQLARTRFPRQTWMEADIGTLAAEPGSYDGIVAWDSLSHLREETQRQLVIRMAQWLRRGGVALFNTGRGLIHQLEPAADEDIFHADLTPATCRALFAQCGLAELAHVAEDTTCGGTSVWLVGRV